MAPGEIQIFLSPLARFLWGIVAMVTTNSFWKFHSPASCPHSAKPILHRGSSRCLRLYKPPQQAKIGIDDRHLTRNSHRYWHQVGCLVSLLRTLLLTKQVTIDHPPKNKIPNTYPHKHPVTPAFSTPDIRDRTRLFPQDCKDATSNFLYSIRNSMHCVFQFSLQSLSISP